MSAPRLDVCKESWPSHAVWMLQSSDGFESCVAKGLRFFICCYRSSLNKCNLKNLVEEATPQQKIILSRYESLGSRPNILVKCKVFFLCLGWFAFYDMLCQLLGSGQEKFAGSRRLPKRSLTVPYLFWKALSASGVREELGKLLCMMLIKLMPSGIRNRCLHVSNSNF